MKKIVALAVLLLSGAGPGISQPIPQDVSGAPLDGPTDTTAAPSDGEGRMALPAADAGRGEGALSQWAQSVLDFFRVRDPYSRSRVETRVGTNLGYDDNTLYSATDKRSSATASVYGRIDYNFGAPRLNIAIGLRGNVTAYENRPGGNQDQTYGVNVAVGYQWTRRLRLDFATNTAYLAQPSPQLVGGIFQFTGNYLYTDTSLEVGYALQPRLGLSLGYSINGIRYEDESINEQSGFYQQNFSLATNWLLSPRVTLSLTYRYNPVTYYESGLGSTGHFLLLGVVHTLSPRLKYQLTFGAEYRQLESPLADGPSSYLGPYAESLLTYNFLPESGVAANLRVGTEPSGVSGLAIRETARGGVSVFHTIGRRLRLEAGVTVEYSRYDQPGVAEDFDQSVGSASVSAKYEFVRQAFVVLRDDYLVVWSSTPNSDYTRNYVSLGMEVSF